MTAKRGRPPTGNAKVHYTIRLHRDVAEWAEQNREYISKLLEETMNNSYITIKLDEAILSDFCSADGDNDQAETIRLMDLYTDWLLAAMQNSYPHVNISIEMTTAGDDKISTNLDEDDVRQTYEMICDRMTGQMDWMEERETCAHAGKTYRMLRQPEATSRLFDGGFQGAAEGETYSAEYSAPADDFLGHPVEIFWRFDQVRGSETEEASDLPWDDKHISEVRPA